MLAIGITCKYCGAPEKTVGSDNTGVTPITRQPLSCPVCGRILVEPLLENFRISAEGDGMIHDVNAMKAFHCQVEGHIFFIRSSDLEAGQLTVLHAA